MRGVLLLILGALMLANPLWSVTALVWIFGIFAIIDGIVAIAEWFAQPQGARRGLVAGRRASSAIAIGLVAVVCTGADRAGASSA